MLNNYRHFGKLETQSKLLTRSQLFYFVYTYPGAGSNYIILFILHISVIVGLKNDISRNKLHTLKL